MIRLKTLTRALCLALGLAAASGASSAASLSTSGGTSASLVGASGTFNPDWFGDASLYASTFDLSTMLQGASLLLDQTATVTYTLVGFEAAFNNAFVAGTERLDNRSGATPELGSSFSFSNVSAAPLDFGFLSSGLGALFGNGSLSTGVLLAKDGQSALLLFNDSYGDRDFDDMVVRISISPVPEPEMLAMLLAGLGVVMVRARRRRV